MIPCRCRVLNTLSGQAATDYARQHLDVVRDDGHGNRVVECPETGTTFRLERAIGPYGGDDQQRLRRAS